MKRLCSTTPTISNADVLDILSMFVDNGSYDEEELIYFVSVLTGTSTDEIVNSLRPAEDTNSCAVPDNPHAVSREKAISMFRSYVNNDAEAADLDYVRETLEQVGCTKTDAKEIGLDWIFEEEEEEDDD